MLEILDNGLAVNATLIVWGILIVVPSVVLIFTVGQIMELRNKRKTNTSSAGE